MQKLAKHSFFVMIMIMLLLPFVQRRFNISSIEPLKGAYSTPEKPVWKLLNFWNGTFQDSLNTHVEQTIGYRPQFVRLHNQLQYSIFNEAKANGVIIGKTGYLYELNYINAYYGIDYVGDEKVNEDVQKAVVVANWLEAKGKLLLIVLAPGKGTFYSEYIPEEYDSSNRGLTNYDAYYKKLVQEQLVVIGGNHFFNAIKDTSRYALFPKSGIHWSYYGMGLVFDSVFQLIEYHLDREYIDFQITNIKVSSELKSPDRDLWEGLNIILPPDDYPMPYPEFKFEVTDPYQMPRVIAVADSYYWQWFGGGYSLKGFGDNSFWYYNEQVFYPDGRPMKEQALVPLFDAVLNTDVILILQTDANMNRFSFGFIDELYELIQK